MRDFKYNRWLIGFILLGLAAAFIVGFERHQVEENNAAVELAIDYEGLVELAQLEGASVEETLRQAKEAGITSLAVYETTFKKLNENGKASAISGSELLKNYHSGAMADENWRALVASGAIAGEDVYITYHDEAAFAEIKEDLIARYGKERVRSMTVGGAEVLAVKANYEKFLKANIGMPRAEMQMVNDAGFYVVARPSNYDQASKENVDLVFSRMEGLLVTDVVFSGEEILGWPNHLAETAEYMKSRGLTLGMIEHPQQLQFYRQEGLMELAGLLGYKAARVYSIPKDEQLKMKIASAVERWETTNQERNMRINLLRAFEKPEGDMTLLETNMTYFKKVKEALEAKGFTIGRAGTYAEYYPNPWLLALMCAGVAAAGVLYLTLLVPFGAGRQYALFFAAAAALIAPIALGYGATARSAAALLSANLFPALAMIGLLDWIRTAKFDARAGALNIAATGAAALCLTAAFSFIGGIYVGAVLADVRYLLEIDIYRGVKLTFVMPIVLVSIAYLRRFHLFDASSGETAGFVKQVKKVLDAPVYVKSLFAFGLAAVAAYVFIGRSGHTAGVPVPGIELKFRAFLEQALYARPRSKELLIGHPAFMLTIMAFYRKWPGILCYVLVVLATIGQGSLVETFAHIRTPIFMSIARGLGGLVFGCGIGAVLILALHVLLKRSSFWGRSRAKHE